MGKNLADGPVVSQEPTHTSCKFCGGRLWLCKTEKNQFYRCQRCGDETYSSPIFGGYGLWVGTVKSGGS